MNQLQIFNNSTFESVRTIEREVKSGDLLLISQESSDILTHVIQP